MKDLVLYCKSYRRDFLRLKRLYESIKIFNKDFIPFYISTPAEDKEELFKVILNGEFQWIADEEIVSENSDIKPEQIKNLPGGVSQAIIKSEFWRLKICKNYVCLDSDCVFIREFYVSDFIIDGDNPYTVIFENKDYFQIAINRNETKVYHNLKKESDRVMHLFGRKGTNYYCPCPPFIWSCKVWKSLEQKLLKPNNINFIDLVTDKKYKNIINPETLIYIECLLKYKEINLYPKEQLFRVYYSDWYYYLLKRLGENKLKIINNYLGVVYQSNWELEMDYQYSGKPFFSKFLKKIKRFTRYIQSFI